MSRLFRHMLSISHAAALALCLSLPAGAVNPDEVLSDPALEGRAASSARTSAASSARTSRSTTPTRHWRATSASSCANA